MKSSVTEPMLHILLVDPYTHRRPALASILRENHKVTVALTEEESLQVLQYDNPSMVIIDAAEKNLEFLGLIQEYNRQIPLLLVGNHPDDEYIGKGFQESALKIWLEHTIVSRQLLTKMASLEMNVRQIQRFGDFLTGSSQFTSIFRILERVADTDVPVLVTGESGTGKELIARGIHEHSQRKEYPFVAINCSAIPENLLETELFGYEKGAFTGATSPKVGKLEYADGGTVFLDEIGDMPILTQAKILRVLQERRFERVGSNRPILFRARFLAATNKQLLEEIEHRTFREDLFYRLNTVHINIPPLRERREDIALLIEHFMQTLSKRYNKEVLGVSPAVFNILQKYDWPGNVRELLNCMHHAILLTDNPRIELGDLPSVFQPGIKATVMLDQLGKEPLDVLVTQAKQILEHQIITMVLEKFNYNKAQSAYYLGITRKTLYRKMKELGI